MKRLTSFVILTAASALVGCASQAPATPSGTGVSPAKVAATSPATGAGQTSVAATASATADNGKFTVPVGWRRVEVNGQERFCRKYIETGSRVAQSETCLTKNQLENLQSGSQQFIQQIQRQGGEMTGQGGATTGGR
jgi:ABC-type phosphate transport system substrate-binding protein